MTHDLTGLTFGLSHEEYHAGMMPGTKPLSSSFAKELINKSPYEAKFAERKDTKAFVEGRALHELALEGELKTFQVFDFEDKRGNKWKDAKEEAAENGLTPIIERDLKPIRAVAKAVREHPIARDLLSEGAAEVSALVEDDGLFEQARFDWLRVDGKRPLIIDLKTVAGTANPREFNKAIANYGYHLQAAMYADVLQRALKLDIEPGYAWIVVSKEKPYAVSVVKASRATMQTGFLLYAKSREIYRESVETGTWAGYDEITESELPMWAEYQAEEITGKSLEVDLHL